MKAITLNTETTIKRIYAIVRPGENVNSADAIYVDRFGEASRTVKESPYPVKVRVVDAEVCDRTNEVLWAEPIAMAAY